MGWDNPPVPWHEFEQRLSWRQPSSRNGSGRRNSSSDDSSAGDSSAGDSSADAEGADCGHDDGTDNGRRGASRKGNSRGGASGKDDGPRGASEEENSLGARANEAVARWLQPVPRLPGRQAESAWAGLAEAERARAEPGRTGPSPAEPAWAELHCHSSYSFLDGASSPGELVDEALQHGLTALAITDHDGMYGVPQFAQAAARVKEASGAGLGTVFGAELSLDLPGGQGGIPDPAGRHLLVLARDPDGYRRLCRVISAAQVAGKEKGRPVYDMAELAGAHDGHWVILTGCRKGAVPAALAAGQGPASQRPASQGPASRGPASRGQAGRGQA